MRNCELIKCDFNYFLNIKNHTKNVKIKDIRLTKLI
jgi:hypothetical protein